MNAPRKVASPVHAEYTKAYVEISATCNLGNYESVKLTVGLEGGDIVNLKHRVRQELTALGETHLAKFDPRTAGQVAVSFVNPKQ